MPSDTPKSQYDWKSWYCPICGMISGQKRGKYVCWKCKNYTIATESKHYQSYYEEIAKEKYGDEDKWDIVLTELEISKNPQYNPNTTEHNAIEEYEEERRRVRQEVLADEQRREEERRRQAEANIPRCPTCGSTDLEKISDLKKATHWLAFGLLSKTARSQFRCKKCGYKW